jgi:hypothetical protein
VRRRSAPPRAAVNPSSEAIGELVNATVDLVNAEVPDPAAIAGTKKPAGAWGAPPVNRSRRRKLWLVSTMLPRLAAVDDTGRAT